VSAPVVRVTSRRAPSIAWPCPRCRSRVFDCSERFRANSSGKLVDIWSIYRCRECKSTKNVTIVERTPVSRVPRPLLLAAEHNDAAVARAYARDVGVLKRNGMAVAEGDDWVLDGVVGDGCTLVFDEPLLVRLDGIIGRNRTVDSPLRVDRLNLWATAVVRLATPLDGPSRRRHAASR
jgi:hypothetical protein